MSAAVISTLIFASPGASAFTGSLSERASLRASAGAGSEALALEKVPSRSESDPCSTFERCNYLAAKRLKIIGKRERRIVALLVRIHKLRARSADGVSPSSSSRSSRAPSPASIICSVFGSHCSEAISVATCESHLNVYARNGQYLGLFQEGVYARTTFGFAWTALAQARSAYRYFLDAGWSPWTCRP